jgi:hypothetical protein
LGAGGDAVAGLDRKIWGDLMSKWEKFTAIGAIGPDLFFFSQDWNYPALEPHSDDIMLALAIYYYYYDFAKENDWEPLIAILRTSTVRWRTSSSWSSSCRRLGQVRRRLEPDDRPDRGGGRRPHR